jgi:thiol-disulfide isomerase/thioredoxin
MIIKILGSGCPNCQKTKALANQVIEELNLNAQVEAVTDLPTIMVYAQLLDLYRWTQQSRRG